MKKISLLLCEAILAAGLLISCSGNSSYRQVKIGNNIWIAKNLKVEQFQNGDPIPQAKTNKEWMAAAEAGKPVWCYYEFDPANEAEFGKIYNLHAINDSRGLAPKGWRMPSLNEWSELKSLGGLEFYVAKTASEMGAIFNELFNLSHTQEEGIIEDASFLNDSNEDDLSRSNSTSSDSTNDEIGLDNQNEEYENIENITDFARIFMPNIDANNRYVNSPQMGFAKAQDTARINRIIKAHVEIYMPENVLFLWSSKEIKFMDDETPYYTFYVLEVPDDGTARVGGQDIAYARVSVDPNTGRAGVSVDMINKGATEWGEMTAENVGNFVAITMDNKVLSAPIINGPIRGGGTLISGGFTKNEAEDLALLLNAGGNQAPVLTMNKGGVLFSSLPWHQYYSLGVGDENLYNGNRSNGYAIRCVRDKVKTK